VIRIGTAGWSIPSRYKDDFPGEGSHLVRYARRFSVVEIDTSFHRHHQASTYARWAASVPEHFRFAVKTPRAMTHEGELVAPLDVLSRFIEEVANLGDKLAVLLVQLPPKLAFAELAVRRFYSTLHERTDVQLVCEPRHPSWASPQVEALLADLGVARVAADPAPWPGAEEPGGFRNFAYFRWHGQPRKYYSDYETERLESFRQQLQQARNQATDVWAIFDNTALGHALGNALWMADGVVAQGRATTTGQAPSKNPIFTPAS
jgi:uncharacterized protein YecE (DUF72 family)